MRRLAAICVAATLLCMLGSTALAKGRSKRKARKKKSSVTVPVNVGLGPSWNMITGPIQEDQRFHYGLRVDLYAVIDKETIKRFKHRIPKKYRGMASRMREVRYRPSILIPDHLFISPKNGNTGIFGMTWRPFGLNLPLIDSSTLRLGVGAGLLLTYAHISSNIDGMQESTHFFRPGVDLRAELVLQLSPGFLLSGGWSSGFYLPQKIKGEGRGFAALGSPKNDDCIWHVGQIFAMLNFRFPYTTTL